VKYVHELKQKLETKKKKNRRRERRKAVTVLSGTL